MYEILVKSVFRDNNFLYNHATVNVLSIIRIFRIQLLPNINSTHVGKVDTEKSMEQKSFFPGRIFPTLIEHQTYKTFAKNLIFFVLYNQDNNFYVQCIKKTLLLNRTVLGSK